jgi:hypothetical protein
VGPHAPAGDVAKGRLLSARREDDRDGAPCLGPPCRSVSATGIARVPFWKFILADASAAIVGVPFSFGLAYFFTDEIGAILADVHRVERWLLLLGLLVLSGLVIVSIVRWNRRVPKTVPGPQDRAATPPWPLQVRQRKISPPYSDLGDLRHQR